jgi:glycosyltransferase involved in cell wall biosynthesis
MTMHDYKLVCASYLLRAGDKICEDCKGGRYYRCFLNRCVKASAAKSLLSTAEMYLHHRIMDIYSLVDAFISPSAFMKRKIEDMGFKGNIVRLPNFIDFTEFRPKYEWTGRTIAYCGRLSAEKGVGTLISAVKGLKDLRLKIIGDGPLRAQLQARAESEAIDNVEFLGYRSRQEVKEDMGSSMFVIMPSECYENNPKAVMEAFALGKPVLGSRLGGIPELVRDGETGFTFEPFDAADMRAKIISLAERPDEIIRMGRNARSFVESEFNAGRYYESLMRIYSDVISGSKRR